MLDKQISALRAPFPVEALSADTSRGFELTSIKAAFVVERLNEVFGPCGCGWRYVHSPFEFAEGEVLTEVALQFRVAEGGCDPVVWDATTRNWAFAPDSGAWSWPIFAPGGRRPNKGTAPLTDARKGSITDGLTKAASMIGVGHEVFKGLVRTGQAAQKAPARVQTTHATSHTGNNGNRAQSGSTPPQKANGKPVDAVPPKMQANTHPVGPPKPQSNGAPRSNGVGLANATTFWQLANKYTDTLDRAVVSALAKQVMDGKINWLEAQTRLDDLIDAATVPSFGQANGVAEKPSDPLDELFE